MKNTEHRLIMLAKGQDRCRACSSKEKLVVHHLNYKKQRVIFLCELCHNFLHSLVKGGDPDNESFTEQFIRGNLRRCKPKKKKHPPHKTVGQAWKEYRETGKGVDTY